MDKLMTACGVLCGIYHEDRDVPCQDSVCAQQSENVSCVALCDGAGSVKGAERVSESAARALAALFTERFDALWALEDDVLRSLILSQGVEAVQKDAPGIPAACTLLLAAMHTDGRCLVCHLGDGAIIASGVDGTGRIFSVPENGRSASETYFLCGPNPMRHLRIYRTLPDWADALLLCSDGVSRQVYELDGTAAPVVRKMVGWLRSDGEAFAARLIDDALRNVFRRLSRDDLSIAILLHKTLTEPEEGETTI